MTKIDIISGFLGAGKTTLIKKLIQEAYAGEKVVLIENEFGEIGIDGGFLQEAGVNITEMNSGCICCSLVGDFSKALAQVSKEYNPERIVIEPSGVGKLSDVIKAVQSANLENAVLNSFSVVVDAGKCKMYMKNFGEFFLDQVENANCIVLSHTDKASEEKVSAALESLKEKNPNANFVTAPLTTIDGKAVLAAMEKKDTLASDLQALERLYKELSAHKHHHEHECDDPDCHCHDHEHHHEHECDDLDCYCHDHGHHHEHECDDPNCHCHDHEHHHHHHADEVFTSWGKETAKKFTKESLLSALSALENEELYGTVLRAKGIVAGEKNWWHFDYVPGEPDVREGVAGVIGRLCVIGCKLNESALEKLFNI